MEAGMSEQRVRHAKELTEGWVDDGMHQAVVTLVARRGVVVLHDAIGRLTPEPDSSPLELDTIFPVMSLTKPITATAAMTLVDDGLLGLNRPVSDYIPEFVGEGKEAVLVHHLLTHTSGLRNEEANAHAAAKRGKVEIPEPEDTQHPTIHEFLFLRYDAPLWKPPGQENAYSGVGYALLGEIVRRLSGKSLAEYAHEKIFAPLGMQDTYYIIPEAAKPRVVRRPADAPGKGGVQKGITDIPHAAFGVYSTAMDMAVFGQMFLNGGSYGDSLILSRAAVMEMTRNQISGIGGDGYRGDVVAESHAEASWGYGWGIHGQEEWTYYPGTLQSPEAFYHSGTGGVYLWVDPSYDLLGAYFCVDLRIPGPHELFVNAVTAAIES